MSEELKPCPFCGGEEIIIKREQSSSKVHIHCDEDRCMVRPEVFVLCPIDRVGVDWESGEKTAIQAWNTRQKPKLKLPEKKESPDGYGCICAAHRASECGCGAEWSNNKPYNQAIDDIKRLNPEWEG